MFWNVYGECDNIGVVLGHTNAITEMCFSTDGATLYTASADKTLMCWDTCTATRIKKLKGLFDTSKNFFCSGICLKLMHEPTFIEIIFHRSKIFCFWIFLESDECNYTVNE